MDQGLRVHSWVVSQLENKPLPNWFVTGFKKEDD